MDQASTHNTFVDVELEIMLSMFNLKELCHLNTLKPDSLYLISTISMVKPNTALVQLDHTLDWILLKNSSN